MGRVVCFGRLLGLVQNGFLELVRGFCKFNPMSLKLCLISTSESLSFVIIITVLLFLALFNDEKKSTKYALSILLSECPKMTTFSAIAKSDNKFDP